MLPATSERIARFSSKEINRRIHDQTAMNVARYGTADPDSLSHRLYQLDNEWDVDRVFQSYIALAALAGTVLAAAFSPWWLIVPGVAALLLSGGLCDGLERYGWHIPKPKGTMFVWAPIPEEFRHMGSINFSLKLLEEAEVAVAPGRGFGEAGEGFLRIALVENEKRLKQAVRQIGRSLRISSAKANDD